MQISKLEARTVEVPLARATRIATRVLPSRLYTWVRASAEDGTQGVGFCLGGPAATEFVRGHLARGVQGRSVFETEAIWQELYQEILLQGRRGAGLRALSAVDIALWDLKGKMLNQPVWALIGRIRSRVPAYASGGYYVEGKTTNDLVAEVAGYVEAGFRAVKIKIGGVALAQDLARVRAVRQAIGPEVLLMLDANNAWPNAHEAVAAIRRFETYAPDWIEEPLPPDDLVGLRRVAQSVQTPIATGEIEATRWGFQALIDGGSVSVVQPDAAVVGGISEWLKIAHLASARSVPVAPHWLADLHVQLAACADNARWIEYFTSTDILNIGLLLRSHLRVEDGEALLPSEPGLGIAVDDEALQRYATDAWA
jgi:L-alanine-DL-glutamate epimerase-like enolase superfamily enzyme